MGTLLVGDILDRAWTKALDNDDRATPGVARWSDDEGLDIINDVMREVVNLLPTANTVASIRPTVPGARQTLAGLGITDGIEVVHVPCNYSLDGETPGRSLTFAERKHFDEFRPYWRRDIANEAEHYILEPLERGVFYLHPAPVDGSVQVVFSKLPALVVSLDDPLPLDDIYANAVQFGVLAHFYAKDSTFTKAPAKVAFWYGLMAQSLGIKDQGVIRALGGAVATSNVKGPQS